MGAYNNYLVALNFDTRDEKITGELRSDFENFSMFSAMNLVVFKQFLATSLKIHTSFWPKSEFRSELL